MRVLVRESIAEAGIELLRGRFDVDDDEVTPLEEIVERYDAIVIRSATKLTAESGMDGASGSKKYRGSVNSAPMTSAIRCAG